RLRSHAQEGWQAGRDLPLRRQARFHERAAPRRASAESRGARVVAHHRILGQTPLARRRQAAAALMWDCNVITETARLSRRAFAAGAGGAACAGALPSFGASQAAPAAARAVMPRWLESENPVFAIGATVGDLTFVAQDAAGPGELPAGATAQAEHALQNLRRALASVGQSADDLVFLQVLLTDYAAASEIGK